MFVLAKDGSTSKILKRLGLLPADRGALLGTLVELGYFRRNPKAREVKNFLEGRESEKVLSDKREVHLFRNIACNKFKSRRFVLKVAVTAVLDVELCSTHSVVPL